MKSATSQLITHLATAKEFVVADLYTFTLAAGAGTLRYTSFDVDVNDGSNTFSHYGPVLARQKTRSVVGLEVSTMDIDVAPKTTDLVLGLSWHSAACGGYLDGCAVKLERAYLDFTNNLAFVGKLVHFVGNVAQVLTDGVNIALTVNSPVDQLMIQMPRNSWQSGCLHTLFDSGCTLLKSAYANGASVGAAPTRTTIAASIAKASGYFDLGTVEFSSGVLSGLKRTVKHWDGSTFTLLNPTPFPPSPGDTFTAYRGCDKKQATCSSADLNNLPNFKGAPYIPVPETSL